MEDHIGQSLLSTYQGICSLRGHIKYFRGAQRLHPVCINFIYLLPLPLIRSPLRDYRSQESYWVSRLLRQFPNVEDATNCNSHCSIWLPWYSRAYIWHSCHVIPYPSAHPLGTHLAEVFLHISLSLHTRETLLTSRGRGKFCQAWDVASYLQNSLGQPCFLGKLFEVLGIWVVVDSKVGLHGTKLVVFEGGAHALCLLGWGIRLLVSVQVICLILITTCSINKMKPGVSGHASSRINDRGKNLESHTIWKEINKQKRKERRKQARKQTSKIRRKQVRKG